MSLCVAHLEATAGITQNKVLYQQAGSLTESVASGAQRQAAVSRSRFIFMFRGIGGMFTHHLAGCSKLLLQEVPKIDWIESPGLHLDIV